MAKRISTTVIGGFVVSGLGLLVAGIIFFGTTNLFTASQRYVLYFDESIKGLQVGSPVMFRGVEVGAVQGIIIQADPKTMAVLIPVTIEIDPERFQVKNGRRGGVADRHENLLQRGLRGKLAMKSLLTGQLMIQLDFLPDTPLRRKGGKGPDKEIPTLPSPLNELTSKLKKLPLEEIAANVLYISEELKELLADKQLVKILTSLERAANNSDKLVKQMQDEVTDTAELLKARLAEMEALLQGALQGAEAASLETGAMMTQIRGEIGPVSQQIKDTLAEAEATLATINQFIGQSESREKMNSTLDSINEASRSLRQLTDYLEQHPEALLRGKR
ncbi:MAG: MlaD family protein [Thermodesulfobacteriota bacterium]